VGGHLRSSQRETGIEDATRRTRLANERTYLAWWRTSLAAIAVAIGVGRIAPGVSHATAWPYEILGAGYALLAIAFVYFAYARARAVEGALDSGGFAPLSGTLIAVTSACGAVLAAATIVVMFVVH
jgi:putative membrane protein